jgi:RNA polymerase sigma-70 factor (ECF subfamily)
MTLLVDDKALRDAFREGDRAALTTVYREYARPIFAFLGAGFSFESDGARRHFGGFKEPWTLEGLVQDVFAKAFDQRARLAYDGLRPYRNYLFTIARNHAIDYLRQRRPDMLSLDIHEFDAKTEGEIAKAMVDGDNPEQLSQARELETLVTAFASSLGDKERVCFELRLRQSRSIESVSHQMEVSEHWVKQTERTLKKRFFEKMRRHGYFEGYRYGAVGVERTLLLMLALGGRA